MLGAYTGTPKRGRSANELTKDFSTWTSANGLPHIWLSAPIWLKLFWFLITAASATGFFYQLIFQLLKNYFNYPVNVDTQVSHS